MALKVLWPALVRIEQNKVFHAQSQQEFHSLGAYSIQFHALAFACHVHYYHYLDVFIQNTF